SDPVIIYGGGCVILPGAAAPFDISIEWVDERGRAIENQSAVPPQLHSSIVPRVNVSRMPLVWHHCAEVHDFSARTYITPKLVTAVNERDGWRGTVCRRGMRRQTKKVFLPCRSIAHQAES